MCLKSHLCFKIQEGSVLSDLEQVMNNPRLTFEEQDKTKETNELMKISFEPKDVAGGWPSDSCPRHQTWAQSSFSHRVFGNAGETLT